MRTLLLLPALLTLRAELPPPGISVSQWVREDLFAGILGNDTTAFERGMSKARELLAKDPDDFAARGWLAMGQLSLAAQLQRTQGPEASATAFAEARRNAKRAIAKNDPSALRTIAAGNVFLADRFTGAQRLELLTEGRELFALVRRQEDQFLDRMPAHFRGELLAGQAQAALRLGLEEEATRYLKEVIARVPDTPYAKIAAGLLEDPKRRSTLVCQSCHEPNRLANRLTALGLK